MVFVIGVSVVIAYNSDFTGGNPAVMGHSSDEIMVDINGTPTSLQDAIDNGNLSGGSVLGSNCINKSTLIGYKEVSLIKNGKNICETPHGCNIVLYELSQLLLFITTIQHLEADYDIYLQLPSGKYIEKLGVTSSETNGDSTSDKIRDWNCDLYDYVSGEGITDSKDNLVLRNPGANPFTLCHVSICSRDSAI